MAKFVSMPHGFGFDLEQVLWYQIVYGDSAMEYIDSIRHFEGREREQAQDNMPRKLLLHFKNGDKLTIPDFESYFLEKWFFPAIDELENRITDQLVSIPQGEDFTHNVGVYFIQGEVTKRIKIGVSDDVKSRIKSLQASEQLRLLHVIPNATTDTESELHKKFSHLRVIGEWFEGKQELVSYINSLKRG